MTAATDTLSAFIGIANENEFFSHHYLAEVFRGDVEETLARWRSVEEAHPGDDTHRAPYSRLRALARDWFATRERIARERSEATRLRDERDLLGRLFAALGYPLQPTEIPLHPNGKGGGKGAHPATLPVLGAFGRPGEPPRLLVIHAWDAAQEGEDPWAWSPTDCSGTPPPSPRPYTARPGRRSCPTTSSAPTTRPAGCCWQVPPRPC